MNFSTETSPLVFILLIPSLFWVLWSFKVYEDLVIYHPNSPSSEEHDSPSSVRYEGCSLMQHRESTIMNSEVCPLGKLGAWIILIWTLVLVKLLYDQTLLSQIFKTTIILGVIHALIVCTIAIVSFVTNAPLFIRTLPYYVVQIIVVVKLCH